MMNCNSYARNSFSPLSFARTKLYMQLEIARRDDFSEKKTWRFPTEDKANYCGIVQVKSRDKYNMTSLRNKRKYELKWTW